MKSISKIQFVSISLLLLLLIFAVTSCFSGNKNYIIVIGDQNSAGKDSWVRMLENMMPEDRIVNFSPPGNTFGFNNLNNENLNTLKNIDTYLDNALDSVGGHKIDYLIISLGGNDCKLTFDKKIQTVPENLDNLIRKINGFPGFKNRPPHLVVLTPLPFGPDSLLPARYQGSDERVRYLIPYYKDIAHQNRCGFIDIYEKLDEEFMKYSPDGLHLNSDAQDVIAGSIYNYLIDHP